MHFDSMEPKPTSHSNRIIVIGGVAAGASAAARMRRLDEFAQITIIERGPDVSFANCGLPYFVGGEITDRQLLAVQNPTSLKAMLNLDVRIRHEAVHINRSLKMVQVRDLTNGSLLELPYDYLILAPGASPLVPPIPGIHHPSISTLRNLEDMDAIVEKTKSASSALVVGAGFIGLEMAEQLRHLDKSVTLVELQAQVLPPLDPEMAVPVTKTLRRHGVDVLLSDAVVSFESQGEGVVATLQSGRKIQADMVILSIGVRPENKLASECGLELGPRGHIRVNGFQQTSDPFIYAAGDAVETRCAITGSSTNVPLGGPANRQGRIIADHICHPETTIPYPGSIGTAIVRVFDLAAGITGLSEKRLQALDLPYAKATVSDFDHASYYPGANRLTVKVLYCPTSLRLLGAQVFGPTGVDKRLDVLATAIRGKMTLHDLEHLELAYAPPFGSAKDPVNIAAFCARNQREGLVECLKDLPEASSEYQIIDVRPSAAQAQNPIPGALNIPLTELRKRLHEIDRERIAVTACSYGKMSYFASRILRQNGFKVKSLAGGLDIR
jgi:NADPH-dependent 2,4-dienoyl-CoA reductase/sulfur reductase-like enzyme/rhodanese-related sulfurtransferase